MLCAKWIILSDGCVARCDLAPNHNCLHLDSVIDISFTDEDIKRTTEKLKGLKNAN